MKKEIGKKLLSIMLTLTLVFTMMPMIPGAVSKAYAEELTKISSLEATSKFADKMKVGKTVPGSLPFPVVTVGQPANVNPVMMLAVYKKNESGVFRYVPSNTPVEPGIYRFETYVSLIQGQGYELDPEMTVTIDGKTCTHDGTITVRNGNVDTITITSGEYEVVAPPDLVFTDSDTLDIPMGEVNEPIDTFSLAAYANGGTAPYTFSKKSGPEWITVSSDGTVSGTPTQVIDANEDLVVQVTDSTDPVQTAEISISVGKTYSPIAVTYVNLSCIALDNIFNIGNAVTIPGNSNFMVTGSSLSDSSVIGISNGIGNSPKWKKFESNTNTWTNLTSTDVFERGGTYKLTGITFYADHTKVKFDEDTVVTVNGNEWEISYIGQNPGYRYVEIESPAVTLREELKEENVALDLGVYTYDGAAKEPATIVKNAADEVLVEGTDYEVSYTNNTSAGTAEVTVTGIGNYSGNIEKTFTINKAYLDADMVSLASTAYTYDGAAKEPAAIVKNAADEVLVEGTDYEVSYTNNTNAGTAEVTVTGIGNYSGNIEKTFTIAKQAYSSKFKTMLSTTNYTYNGSAKKPSVTAYNSAGKKLVNGTDYTVSYASGRTKIGKYKVTVTFKGNYSGSKDLYFEIGPKNPSSVKTTLYGYNDVKVSWSKVSGASGYKVYYKKSSDSSWTTLLKTTTATSYKKANLPDGVKYDFKVVTYKKVNGNACENAGKTSSIYTLKNVTGVKATKSGTKVKVSWTNISGETGYQISQSTSSTGTKIVATYATTSGKNKTVSATEGKTYYYKVRAYKVVGSTKIYGPWSSVVKYKR